MKQIKISSFFTAVGARSGKRTSEETESSSSEKVEPGNKKRKTVMGKRNKENGCRKLMTAFGSKPNKPVLSPKKLSENIKVSPIKEKSPRNLEWELDDVGFEEFLESDSWHQTKSDLVLSRPIRCEVVRFAFNGQPNCEQIVRLKAIGSEKTGICKLRDMWTFVNVNVGEIVCVKANESDGEWIVNGKDGFIIIEPDVTLSVTTLLRGMYCLRRGILSNLHKNVGSDGRSMIMGRVVHDLFQESLRKKFQTEDEVRTGLNELLSSQNYLREFYLSGMKLREVTLEAENFVPKIVNFIGNYLKGDGTVNGNNFRGRITDIVDIEELVKSSSYGVQGRVDVTVKVGPDNCKRLMPLELKTGRASFSKEHRIQVMMYTLLLDEVVRNIDSGLLLYLRDEVLEEVKPDFREIRDFLLLRNEFVKYTRNEAVLPDPIRSSVCGQCSYARLCNTYLRHSGLDSLSPNHPIRELNFPDISDSHVDYFIKWTKMIFMESPPDKMVLEDVVLEEEPIQVGDCYRHSFRLRRWVDIHMGETIMVGLQWGKVVDVSDRGVVLNLGGKLKMGESYRIESSKLSFQQLHLTNLAFLLGGDRRRLRELIIDRVSPEFEPGIAKNLIRDDYLEIMKPLNREQRKAIFKVMAAKEYLLIRGPPGTGKTETIVSLIKFLNLQNMSVLVTGHTHSSIDNILLKLNGIDYLRFGSLSNIDGRLHGNCFAQLIGSCSTMEQVERLYGRKVMASTCLGLDLDLIDRIRFDVCLIDESSQVMQTEAIRPLLMCRKFVLIGDSNQLPPVVKNPEAKKLGMDESIFERLEKDDDAIVLLTKQYRMNEALNNLANDLTYGSILSCGNSQVSAATLNFSGSQIGWIRDVLSPEMDKSIIFVDTSDSRDHPTNGNHSRSNPIEARIICRLLIELKMGGIREEDVGVVSPFCSQVQLVTSLFQSLGIRNVQVSTVDQFQGRDKDVMILSCVKRTVSDSVDGHILNDHRRLTVAVTRARVKLVIIGDAQSISVYSPMKKLLSLLTQNQFVRLKNGENDFSIDDIELETLSSFHSYIKE